MTYNYNYNHSNVDSYNYNNYVSGAGTYSRTHATGFDERVASERASQIFWDAVSVTSSDHNSLAMSQYHSVQELSAEDQNAHLRVIQLNIILTRSNSINIDSKSSHFSLAHTKDSLARRSKCGLYPGLLSKRPTSTQKTNLREESAHRRPVA